MALRTTTKTLKIFRWLCQHGPGHESSDVFKVYNTNTSAWIAIFIMLLGWIYL